MYEQVKQYYVDLGLLVSYWATDEQRKRAEAQEQAVREFLLANSEMVRLTATRRALFPVLNWKHFSLVERRGHDTDPQFMETLEALKDSFVEKVTNNERYQVEQGSTVYDHYLYRLTPQLKELFNAHTLLWYPSEHTPFYTFEDPTFYKEHSLVGHVASHESQVFLNITPTEKVTLETQGVAFDPTMEDMDREREESKKGKK